MLNSVVLVGRAGADPDLKWFESGRAKTTFNVAVNRPVKRTEGVDSTDWFRIEIWGKQAEIAKEYVRKGTLVGIQGRLEYSRWTDAEGVKHEMPVISCNNMRLMGSKSDNQGADRGGNDSDGGFGF